MTMLYYEFLVVGSLIGITVLGLMELHDTKRTDE